MDVEPKKQGPTQKHPKNKHSQEQAPKKQGLSAFFTYDYQSDLIHYAQMLDPSYEGALIEYWGIFTAHLIKCFGPVEEELRKNFIIDGPITVSRLDVYNPSENYSISKIVDIIVSHFGRVKCFNLLLSELENNEYYRNFKDEKQLLFKDGQYRYIRVESRDADK